MPSIAAAAPPPNLWKAGEEGPGAGQTFLPRGIAASPNVPGTVYVADQSNHRISLFSAWGQFIEAWGWGVRDGSSEFQICDSETGCVSGLEGEAPGAFKSPQGIVVDSSGNVFVVDRRNYRVQKFDSEGNFLLMFGGGVNQGPTNPGNLCTAQNLSEGDTCGAGSIGGAPGEFGAWPVGSVIALDPAGNVSVGDDERIEKFTPGGAFIELIEPSALAGKGFVQSLAQDASGNYYVAIAKDPFSSENNVQKVSPGGASVCTMSVQNPRAIGVDESDTVYVAREEGSFDQDVTVERFDSGCANLEDPIGAGQLDSTTGIGFGAACHSSGTNIYLTNAYLGNSFIRAFGPAPDNDVDCPPPQRPPLISAQFATKVDASSAILKAEINPRFWKDTSYFVEYGLGECKAEECDQLANSPGVQLGAGIVDEVKTTAAVPLPNLEPGTTYHYRFVAESSGGGPAYGIDPDGPVGGEEATFEGGLEGTFTTMAAPPSQADGCANAALREGPGANLADCRAYEMVSPVDKEGGEIIALTNDFGLLARRDRAAAGGEAMTYSSYRAFADPASAPYMSQYLAERTEAGWSNRSISPPRDGPMLTPNGLDTQYIFFSEDLSQGWLIQDAEPVLASGGVPGFINAYRRENASDSYVALSTEVPVNTESERYVLEILGASDDGSHAVFATNDYLPGGASEGVTQIYDSVNGALSPVCILPNGTRSPQPCTLGTARGSILNQAKVVDHAISEDGSLIYWTANDLGPGRLYLRVDGEETLAVSDLVSPGAAAQFWTAAADGSKAIFSIGPKLYEYDLASESVEEIAGGLIGVAGASEDASRVYLASEEVLDEGAQAGKGNLYLYEAGEAPSFELAATLADSDAGGSTLSPVAALSRLKVSRVTPDGSHIVFMSQAPLTGADNLDANSGEADAEVFRFDAAEDRLACVSCNRTGARPSGRDVKDEVNINVPYWAAAQIPIAEGQTYTSRILSADGNRVFFESFQPLVLADNNAKQDVYEWQEAGAGSCDEADLTYDPASGGCVSLISSGESPQDSELLDASASGSDVFFTTTSSLVAQDPGLIDVYDARAGGGFPPPTPPPLQCEGEACQAAPLVPEIPTPSSSLFVGPGNPPLAKAPKRCPKGTHKAKRKGKVRCVKNKGKGDKARQKRATGRAGR
ncbi:MAG: hypothetical protein JJE35_04875 [Thermoleophilia bacterium]|nr:hypothetical protein [Thermoleophilia bacterium]